MPFQYKCVLLVGATSGIGAAMADKLVLEGSKVIAVGRRQDRLDAFVAKHGPEKAGAVRYDITDSAGLDAFVAGVVKTYPDLDCVFLNSGTQHPTRISRPAEIDLAKFHAEINVNFTCIVNLSVKFLPVLQAKPVPTSLIITGTFLAIAPAASLAAYSASKAALSSFIGSLQAGNKKAQTKTAIVEIWPPVVQTELHDYMGEEAGRSMGMPVDQFVDETYAQLAAGAESVMVGTLGGTPKEEVYEVIERLGKMRDRLTTLLMHAI
ncbi:NAD(P)-binding protein [Thozetella sp. PMI_491]|nr:NAD(P)-binding protein [Thozetella sp. PMI_491]